MKTQSVKAFVIFGLFLFSACASTSETSEDKIPAPDWVVHPQTLYPEARYMVAVGSGNSRNEAILDAKKNLAESFMVKVKSQTQSNNHSSLSQDTTGSVSGKSDQNIEKQLSLETDTNLRGAEVKEVAEGRENYALVALDKLKARSGLLLEMQKSQAKLDRLYESLQSHPAPDQWVSQFSEAQLELKKLDQLSAEATALGMGGMINSNAYELKFAKLDQENRAKIKKYIFAVKTAKGETYFQHDIEECIGNHGGTVYTFDRVADSISGHLNRIELEVVERPQHLSMEGWTKIRFDLTASVTQLDGKLLRVQTTKTETGRSRNAILESVSDGLAKDFCEKLFSRL